MNFFYVSKEADQQIVAAVVYQGTPPEYYHDPYMDSQGDWCRMDTLKTASREWMAGNRLFDLNHEGREYKFPVLESMVIDMNGQKKFGHELKKGAWLMVLKVDDNDVWQKIKSAELTGFSIGGSAYAEQ